MIPPEFARQALRIAAEFEEHLSRLRAVVEGGPPDAMASATCGRCPSPEHDVYYEKAGRTIVLTIMVCRLCRNVVTNERAAPGGATQPANERRSS